MTSRKLLLCPKDESLLRNKSLPVNVVDEGILQLSKDLIDTLYEEGQVVLSAPQIGVNKCIMAIRISTTEYDDGELTQPLIIVNPEIINIGPSERGFDDCPNLPNLFGFINRPASVEVRGQDLKGKPINKFLTGLDASAFQHAFDHLNGVLYTDYVEDFDHDLFAIRYDKIGRERFIPYSYYSYLGLNE